MQIPANITQGDTVVWRDSSTTDPLGNVIDSSWTLTWYFAGPTLLQVTGTANGTGWQTTLTAAQTAALTSSASREPNYTWQAKASKSGQVFTIGSGQLRIDQSLSTAAAGYDGRSQAELDLAAVQAAIRARVTGGAIQEYWIGTRRLKNEPVAELRKLEAHFKIVVANERRARLKANGSGDPRNKFVRFT